MWEIIENISDDVGNKNITNYGVVLVRYQKINLSAQVINEFLGINQVEIANSIHDWDEVAKAIITREKKSK